MPDKENGKEMTLELALTAVFPERRLELELMTPKSSAVLKARAADIPHILSEEAMSSRVSAIDPIKPGEAEALRLTVRLDETAREKQGKIRKGNTAS